MKIGNRAAKHLWLLALGSSLVTVACGGDEGATPVCPTVADCTTPPGEKPSSADGGTDADDTADGDIADESGDESDE